MLRLHELRTSANLTQRELAEKIGMPYPTFRVKITGKSDWKLPEIYALIRVTGLVFDELF